MEYLTVITHIEPNQLNKKNGIRIDLLSRKTAKDFGRRNMKNINTKKLGLFPNFGNWGMGDGMAQEQEPGDGMGYGMRWNKIETLGVGIGDAL